MKKKWILLSAALAAALSGCGPRAAEETPPAAVSSAPPAVPTVMVTVRPTQTPLAESPEETEKPVRPTAGAPVVSTPEPTLQPEPTPSPEPPDVPSDEAVLLAYRQAAEAYNWFVMATLPGDQTDQREVDGIVYTRVADPRFATLDNLRGYLKSLFSDELVDALLPTGGTQYVDLDGALYVQEGARGADITKGGVTLIVLWPEEAAPVGCTVQATVEVVEWSEDMLTSTVVGQETYSFPYQKVGEKWVFTQFESIF